MIVGIIQAPAGSFPSCKSFSSREISCKLFAFRINSAYHFLNLSLNFTPIAPVVPFKFVVSVGTSNVRDLTLRIWSLQVQNQLLPKLDLSCNKPCSSWTHLRCEGRWLGKGTKQLLGLNSFCILDFLVIEETDRRISPYDPKSIILKMHESNIIQRAHFSGES